MQYYYKCNVSLAVNFINFALIYCSQTFHPYQANVTFIWKPVNLPAVQINWMVSM